MTGSEQKSFARSPDVMSIMPANLTTDAGARRSQAHGLSMHYWHAGPWLPSLDIKYKDLPLSAAGHRVLACQIAFRRDCPPPRVEPPRRSISWPHKSTSGALLFTMQLGHLTNCHMVLNFARWLAELLGKTVAMLLCTEGAGCYGSLRASNLSSVWDAASFSQCRTTRQRPTAPTEQRRFRHATCLAEDAQSCAFEVAADPRLAGTLVLDGFVHYALPTLAAQSLQRQGECGDRRPCDWPSVEISADCRRLVE